LTPREFAARHGLNPANLQRWRRRFPASPPTLRLIEVPFPFSPSQPPAWEAELGLAAGVTVRLRGELAREILARLLEDRP